MSVPQDLHYTQSHEWLRIEGDQAVVGITHYAQDQLGEVVFVELPAVGDAVEADTEMGTLESVKAVSELLAPMTGEIVEINDQLETEPNLVNNDPYSSGWLVKISGTPDMSTLMDAEAYSAFLAAEA
jgi:glycine cleavage system H protein